MPASCGMFVVENRSLNVNLDASSLLAVLQVEAKTAKEKLDQERQDETMFLSSHPGVGLVREV